MRAQTRNGFTLVEMMISVAVLVFIVVILTSFMNTVSATWTTGDQRASTFQDGRAILDVIGRELTQAAMSNNLQFVALSNITNTRANSDSIFWQAPLTYRISGSSTPLTNLCEVGYYVIKDNPAAPDTSYILKRFFVPPSDTTNFQIYSSTPFYNSATWVTNYLTATGPNNVKLSTTIATGVIAFWVRCLDINGDLIPWTTTTGHHYNSTQRFRPAVPGVANSFTYTSNTNTTEGNLLPNAVELTIVMIDDKTLRRSLANPAMISAIPTPNPSNPSGVPAAMTAFNNSLITNKVSTARTFTSRIVIPNSVRQ